MQVRLQGYKSSQGDAVQLWGATQRYSCLQEDRQNSRPQQAGHTRHLKMVENRAEVIRGLSARQCDSCKTRNYDIAVKYDLTIYFHCICGHTERVLENL